MAPGVALAGIVAAALVAFAPALWAGFLADDFVLLRTVDRIDELGAAFERNDLGEAGEAGHFYRPLWVLWNVGIFEVFGDAALAFHASNLLLYAVIAVEVWALARLLLGEPAAWIAGAFFALYPRHAESVSWISGSTDLVATALVLASLLAVLAEWPPWARVSAATAFAAAAALAKESAFVLPLLVVVLLWVGRNSEREVGGRIRWLLPGAILLAQLSVLAVRQQIVGGAGGYAYPWGPLRAAGAAGSYLVGALTPPQLEVLVHPPLLLVPAVLLGGLAFGAWRLRKRGERRRLRVVAAGTAWFFLSLLPVLSLVLDLNTANGERLLFLPSVGLALVVAAVVAGKPGPRGVLALVLAGALLLLSSLQSATNWLVAGRIADRVVGQAAQVAPRDGELILLSTPDNYRTAHVLLSALPAALERAGRNDTVASWCIPVQIRSAEGGAIRFRKLADGSYEGTTTWAAPFDFPVLRDPTPLAPDCSYSRSGPPDWPPGLELAGRAHPTPSRERVTLVYFDGHDLVEVG